MQEADMAIPHLFMCPISLDLFKDPVTLSTGQTYDRANIEKWLATGNLTCPVTMQKLQDPSMVPNHTLRRLIDQWTQNGHHVGTSSFKQIEPDFSLAVIKHTLESPEASQENKLQALAKIETLSIELPGLIQIGLFSLLLELVFGKVERDREALKFIEQSLVCVLNLLPFSELGSLNMLKEESKIANFVLLFEQDSIIIKKSLCQLVEAISSSLYNKELCIAFGERVPLLEKILLLLLHDNTDISEAGIKSISALCSLESNKQNLVRAGTIQGLATYILGQPEKSLVIPMAMETLEVLLGLESAKGVIVNYPNGVNAIVKMVFRMSDHEGSESAVNSLMIICCDSLQAQEMAISAGVLSQLLLLLQSQCSERIKKRARMLLKLLRSTWTEDLKQA